MKTIKAKVIDRDFLKDWARIIIHAVHKADEAYREPFKDDAEYEGYLWNVQRELFEFVEEVQRRSK